MLPAVLVADRLAGESGAIRWFIQPFPPPFSQWFFQAVAILGGSGPATGRLFVVHASGERPVTAHFPAFFAAFFAAFLAAATPPATAAATAASSTALALLVITATPWCGIGLGAFTRACLGAFGNGPETSRFIAILTPPFMIPLFMSGRTHRLTALLLCWLSGWSTATKAKGEFILLTRGAAGRRFDRSLRYRSSRWLWLGRLPPSGLRRSGRRLGRLETE